MQTVFVTGIPIFIYALGIQENQIRHAVLVKILDDNKRDGLRPFNLMAEIFSDCCFALGVTCETLTIDFLNEHPEKFADGDYIDTQILQRLNDKSLGKRKSILALQAEYVNFMRPSFRNGYSPSLRKRIDFLIKIIIPNRIRKFYSLAPNPKRSIYFKELSIDLSLVKVTLERIFQSLITLPRYGFLRELQNEYGSGKTVVILPFASHFNGTRELNSALFHFIRESIGATSIEKLIVKNHPSDSFDYSELFPNSELFIGAKSIYQDFERTLPLEILVQAFEQFRFIGIESTVNLILRDYVYEPPVIVVSKTQHSEWFQNYTSGETRKMFVNQIVEL
jgi:hypothetical protein